MSEDKTHFRIKRGDLEIEYTGKASDVNSRYEKALELIATLSPKPSETKHTEGKETGKKPTGRGGARSNIISRAVDGLITEHWIGARKKITEIVEELKNRAVAGVEENNVNEALKRRVGKTVDRIKDKSDGEWVYSERTQES
jgi:hypothetical protein